VLLKVLWATKERVKSHRLRTAELYVVLLGKCELRKHRRSGCHTVPKGITGVLSALSSVQIDNKIAFHSYKNSKNSVQYPNNAKVRILLGPV
jgi:hypothetical protein